MKRIVLTGGTGFVGGMVAARAAARWPQMRVLVPTRQRAAGRHLLLLPTVDLVECDVHDARQIGPLLQGADALVHGVAIRHGSAATLARVHADLPRTLAAACREQGVQRVVHLSALGAAADAPSMYLRSKAAGEAVWQGSGLEVTLLRPSVIFGAEDQFTNLFVSLQRVFPLLPLAGAQAQFQPVWVRDVADAVLACLADPAVLPTAAHPPGPPGPPMAGLCQVVECAGPEVLTLKQIVQRVGAMAGCRRPVIALPEWLGRLQAAALGLMPGPALMSADDLASMRVPNVASGKHPGLAALGVQPASLDVMTGRY